MSEAEWFWDGFRIWGSGSRLVFVLEWGFGRAERSVARRILSGGREFVGDVGRVK